MGQPACWKRRCTAAAGRSRRRGAFGAIWVGCGASLWGGWMGRELFPTTLVPGRALKAAESRDSSHGFNKRVWASARLSSTSFISVPFITFCFAREPACEEKSLSQGAGRVQGPNARQLGGMQAAAGGQNHRWLVGGWAWPSWAVAAARPVPQVATPAPVLPQQAVPSLLLEPSAQLQLQLLHSKVLSNRLQSASVTPSDPLTPPSPSGSAVQCTQPEQHGGRPRRPLGLCMSQGPSPGRSRGTCSSSF